MSTILWEPDSPAVSQPSGADKYYGSIATGYDAKREDNPKWIAEQRIIEGLLADFAPGTRVLDVPIGTGRFIEAYRAKGFDVLGVDKSTDMLAQAMQKAAGDPHIAFLNGDVRALDIGSQTFDVGVMCRLTRWLSPEDCKKALRELQRVCRKRIILTARVADHPHARTEALFKEALDGWEMTQSIEGHEPQYRVLVFEPFKVQQA